MIDDSGRVQFSPDYMDGYRRNPEHKHYVDEIVDEVNTRRNGFFIGPFRELEYPLRAKSEERLDGQNAFEDRTIEGEFDVMAIAGNRLIYYEVKTGERSIHGSRRQFRNALNFSSYNDYELDFNVLATSPDFVEVKDFLDSTDDHFTRGEFEDEIASDNRVDLLELQKTGVILDTSELFPGYRLDPEDPDQLYLDELVDHIDRDGHIIIPKEGLEKFNSGDEDYFLKTPHLENFYSRVEVDEMVEDSLTGRPV